MKVRLKYYVILSLDIYKNKNKNYTPLYLRSVKPSIVKYPKFKVTETEVEDTECYHKHRKYVGILSPEELEKFCQDKFTDTCQTMGSICELGWIPAISFSFDGHEGCYLNAYISPILNEEDESLLLKDMTDHPQPEAIRERVGYKLEQSLNLLKNFYQYEHAAKSFLVDIKQTTFEFMIPRKEICESDG